MSSNATPRVGIVGLGGIGHHHANQLGDLDATLVGGVDIDADARAEFADAFGVETFENAEELYAITDAVIVTTPNRFHEEYATGALEAGLDVLLEKPLAHTLESAERIATAASDAPGFCMVGFNNRFSNAVEVIEEYKRQGQFGDLSHVEANYLRQRGIPGRGSWFTNEAVAGGGSLIDLGVHAIDLALYFFDHPEVVEVTGMTRSQFGTREDYADVDDWGEDEGPENFDVDDSVSAFIRCADGQTISLEVAWAANRPTNDEFFVRGTEAGARLDRGTQELTLFESDTAGADHLRETDVETRERTTHQAEQAVFLEGVRDGEHPGTNTVEEALRVQQVIDAIYRSAERGASIELSPATGKTPIAND